MVCASTRPRMKSAAASRRSSPHARWRNSPHLPLKLSGGQRQRVALARAGGSSQLLLLDEPLSALDANLRKEMQIELKLSSAKSALPSCSSLMTGTKPWRSRSHRLLRDGALEQVASARNLQHPPRPTPLNSSATRIFAWKSAMGYSCAARCAGLRRARWSAIFSLRPKRLSRLC